MDDDFNDILTSATEPPGRQLTVPRAAAILGISATVMHSLLDGGAIPYTVPSKHRRVLMRDLMAYQAHVKGGGQRRKRRTPFYDFLAAG
jgi:hypothetical protein